MSHTIFGFPVQVTDALPPGRILFADLESFARQVRQEDVRALALAHLERSGLGVGADTEKQVLGIGADTEAQTCGYCGCWNAPDSCKCDDCGFDLPPAKISKHSDQE